MVLVHYDVKLSGESVTYPHIRTCPFVEETYRTLVSGVLAVRGSGTDDARLTPGTLAILVDGGKVGNKKAMLAAWRPSGKDASGGREELDEDDDADAIATQAMQTTTCRQVVLFKDEESLRTRRFLNRGTAVLQQSESIFLITAGPLNLPERACPHYGGTNRGTIIGPITTPATETEWKLSVKDPRRTQRATTFSC